ncbi:hypothetical protein MMC29_000841 [Sticta canariensis]|nr:hypothetical protein [Sticta canariensis]
MTPYRELTHNPGTQAVVASGEVGGERVDDERDVTPPSPPDVVSLEKPIHEFKDWVRQGDEGDVAVFARVEVEDPHGDGDMAQKAGRRGECGPGGDEGVAVYHTVQFVRDILLRGALTGDGVTHLVSRLPTRVQQSETENIMRLDGECAICVSLLAIVLDWTSRRLDLGVQNDHVNAVAELSRQIEEILGFEELLIFCILTAFTSLKW